MRPVVPLVVLLVSFFPLPAVADESAGADDRRFGWYFPGGALRKVDAVRWQEKANAVSFTYQEVDRKPNYVELHDPARRLSVRVYNTALYAWHPQARTWYL